MDANEVQERLNGPLDEQETLRLLGADLGRSLASPVRPELRAVQVALARAKDRSEWGEGYRQALMDVLADLEAELAQQERQQRTRALALKDDWKLALSFMYRHDAFSVKDLEDHFRKHRSNFSRMLKHMRGATPPLVEAVEAGEEPIKDKRLKPHRLTLAGAQLARELAAEAAPVPQPSEQARKMAIAAAHLGAQLAFFPRVTYADLGRVLQDEVGLDKPQAGLVAQFFVTEAESLGLARREGNQGLVALAPSHNQAVVGTLDESLESEALPKFLEPVLEQARQQKAKVVVRTELARDLFNNVILGLIRQHSLKDPQSVRTMSWTDLRIGMSGAQTDEAVVMVYESRYLLDRDRRAGADVAGMLSKAATTYCLALESETLSAGIKPLRIEA